MKTQWVLSCTAVVALGMAMTGWTAAQSPVLMATAARSLHPPPQVDPPAPLAPAPAPDPLAPPVSPTPPAAAPEPLPAPQASSPSIKDDLFAGTEKFAKGASDVTEVTMDPDSLEMVGGADAKRAHRMVLNVVRTYTYDKPGMYNMADVEEFRHKLETGDWHCSVHIRDLKNGNSTDVCSKRRAPDMIESAIITVEPKGLTFVHTIRKANGEGSMNPGGLRGFDFLSGMPPDVMMALVRPELQAEMQAGMAELHAHRAEMMTGMDQMRIEMGPGFQKQMDELHLRLKIQPEVKPFTPEQIDKLQDQMHDLQKLAPLPKVAPIQ